jgi:protein-tyrosine phosphatase
MDASPESFSILTVCDGNVCRSVAAQFTIAQRLPHVRVESAGMRARTDDRVCELVAIAIAGDGEAAARFTREFRSRRQEDLDLASFDLVLAATTRIRGDLARSFPALRDRFFTLREAADVLHAVQGDTAAEPVDQTSLVAILNRYRGAGATTPDLPPRLRMRALDPLDIPDGHGERPKRHRAVVELVLGTAAAIGESLARLAFER